MATPTPVFVVFVIVKRYDDVIDNLDFCNMALNLGAQKSRSKTSPSADSTVYREKDVSVSSGERVNPFGGSLKRQPGKLLRPYGRSDGDEAKVIVGDLNVLRYGLPLTARTEAVGRARMVGIGPGTVKPVATGAYLVEELKTDARFQRAVEATLKRVPELLRVADQERADAIIKASIEAALPLQRGVREQAELAAGLIADALGRIPMLTAREVGLNAASKSDKPEGLAAQWVNRQQVFVVDLREAGLRYPAFQFQPESGKPWPSLAKVLPRLQLEMPALDLLLWFDAPHPALGHAKPTDCLHDLGALERALEDSIALVDIY